MGGLSARRGVKGQRDRRRAQRTWETGCDQRRRRATNAEAALVTRTLERSLIDKVRQRAVAEAREPDALDQRHHARVEVVR